jgi:hypothetical protein
LFVRVFSKRVAILPVTALGALALVGVGAGAAHAAVTGGTVTLTFSDWFTDTLRAAHVHIDESGAASVTYGPDHALNVTYDATGGTASLVSFSGVVDYSGWITFSQSQDKDSAALGGLEFDLTDGAFNGVVAGTETPLFDLAGAQFGNISGAVQSYSAAELVLDAAGAAALDSALGTTVFAAGTAVGGFTTTWS